MTLGLYLSQLIGIRVLLALLGLTALLQIVDLLDATGTLFAAGEGAWGMAVYTAWRLPVTVQQVLPMAVLAGTLVALFNLVRHNEIIAMRSVGVTSYRVIGCALPVALAMTLLHFLLADRVAPWAEPRFAMWWDAVEADARAAEGRTADADEPPRVWMRAGDHVIAVARGGRDRTVMRDLTFLTLGVDGTVQQRIEARIATLEDGRWILHDVQEVQPDGGAEVRRFAATRSESAGWPLPVPAEEVLSVAAAPRSLSTGRLLDILRGTTPGSASRAFYRTTLQHSFALLLTAPLMVLLAVPAAFGNARHGGAGRGVLLGALLGIASLAVDGILNAMGEVGLLPPALAAWAAPALFACIGGTIMLRLEES